jgi:hypothetical protein
MKFGNPAVPKLGNWPATSVPVVIILFLTLGVASCSMWAPKTTPTWGSATTPEQYERLMWEAVRRGDVREVTKHLSSTYVRVTPSGRKDREATIEDLRKLRLSGFEISDLTSAPEGDNFVVSYTLATHGSYDAQPLPEQPWRVMTVWRVAHHGWMMVAQSFTPVEQAVSSKP